jgi:hypothetical protein
MNTGAPKTEETLTPKVCLLLCNLGSADSGGPVIRFHGRIWFYLGDGNGIVLLQLLRVLVLRRDESSRFG